MGSDLRPGWKLVTLGEIATFINGDRGSNYPKHSDYVEKGIPFVNTGHIDPSGWLALEEMQYISRAKHEQLRSGHLKRGDIVYCLRGSTIGKIARVNLDEGAVASSLVIIRANECVLQEYLYHFLASPIGQEYVQQHDNGSAQPNLSVSAISKFPILLPSMSEQRNICKILNGFDNNIQLNRQTNQTLEQMAQALFKSWFVNFDPVLDNALAAGKPIPDALQARAQRRQQQLAKPDHKPLPEAIRQHFPCEFEHTEALGWVPKGWKISTVGEHAEFKNGFAFKSKELVASFEKSVPVFKMGHIKRGGGFNIEGTKSYFPRNKITDKISSFYLEKGDVLMAMTDMKSNMAILGNTALMPENKSFLLNQRVGRLRIKVKNIINYPYLYFFTNYPPVVEELRSRSNSGVQVNLTGAAIKNTPMLVPPKTVHSVFDTQALIYLEKIIENNKNLKILERLRDMLLPKLISGELHVPSVEKEVSDAVA